MLSSLSSMTLMWLVAMLVFAVAEAATVGLVSIWFAVGAMVSMLASALGAPVWLQVLLFLVVSVAMLFLLRPFVKKVSGPAAKTNADRHLEQTALVTEEINNLLETGAVKLDGVTWTARSQNGETIPVGTVIRVKKIAGVKLFVEPAEMLSPETLGEEK